MLKAVVYMKTPLLCRYVLVSFNVDSRKSSKSIRMKYPSRLKLRSDNIHQRKRLLLFLLHRRRQSRRCNKLKTNYSITSRTTKNREQRDYTVTSLWMRRVRRSILNIMHSFNASSALMTSEYFIAIHLLI